MKKCGRVTCLPLKTIPKRRFIPVTNPRKQQFQPPEMAKNYQKQAVWTGVGGGQWSKTWFMDLVSIQVAVLKMSTKALSLRFRKKGASQVASTTEFHIA